MHIVFAHHLSLAYYGGGEKWVISLAKELTRRGHDVEICALPLLLDGKPKVNPDDVLDGISYKEGFRHKVKADLVYITYHPLSWFSFTTSHPRIAGVHSFTYWMNPNPRYGLLPNSANIVNRFCSYFELRRFDAVHAVSKLFTPNHPRVFYIPNFVDSEKFKPSQKDDEFTVIYASRKVWQKGWDIFKEIELSLGRIKIKTSGDIPEDELPPFFSSGHVTIVPSRVDTFGLSIVESLLCETPVITTPLAVHEALNLPLEYASSPREYVNSINHFQTMDPSDYKAFVKQCRIKALQYDKKVVVDKIEDMFKKTIGE